MVETIFKITRSNEKTIHKVIQDENLNYIHVILKKGDGLPEHFSNSNLYMTVLLGNLSIWLGDQQVHEYDAGSILKIPVNTKMSLKNLGDDILELIIIKAPAPKS